MKNIGYRTDNNILYINIDGRIDASNAPEYEEKINEVIKENQGMHTVLDADNLEYISSAGLRIILRLQQTMDRSRLPARTLTQPLGCAASRRSQQRR